MNATHILSKALNLACISSFCALLLSACSQDAPLAPDPKNDYTVNWIKKFGLIDENQNWSVAGSVIADVTPSRFGKDVTVYIYTSNPTNGGKLIGKTNKSTTLHLDMLKGSEMVFVQAIDSKGCCYENSYYPIINGKVAIDNNRTKSRSISDVSLGETKTFARGYHGEVREPSYNSEKPYTIEEAKAIGDTKYLWRSKAPEVRIIAESEYYSYNVYDFYFKDIYDNEHKLEGIQYNFTLPAGFSCYGGFTDEEYTTYSTLISQDMNKRLIHPESHEVVYQRINGVESTHNKTVAIADLAPLFGSNGYFEEQRTPSCLEKWKDDFHPDVTFDIEGPLTLDFMYGATQNSNTFGYYYWSDGEEPCEAKRYILINNATPQANISINSANNYLTNDMQLSGIMTSPFSNPAESTDILYGTSYKVPYFDKNGNASYDFPKGTKIAFFLLVNGYVSSNPNGLHDSWFSSTNLSVQSHNYHMGRTFSGYSRENTDSDPTMGEIDAISFKYGNQIYLGFEDRGGDKDMNDIVFFVTGKATPKEEIVEINVPTPDTESWVIACEDLGSTDDYDFNDIVFSVAHVAGEDELTITPLAAGGTLRAEVMFNSNPINSTAENSEIHYLVSGTKYTANYPMINTQGSFKAGSPFTVTVDSDFSISENLSKFTIKVENKEDSYIITIPDDGTAPQILCLPGDWEWPTERTDIEDAYPDFKNWKTTDTALGWLSSKVQSKVISRK